MCNGKLLSKSPILEFVYGNSKVVCIIIIQDIIVSYSHAKEKLMQPNIPPEFVAAGAWLWDSFGKELIESSISTAKNVAAKQWQKVEWALAAKRYRHRVYELYSTMRMLGNPVPVSVEGIFTELYLHDKPQAFQRFDIERLRIERKQEIIFTKAGFRTDAIKTIKENDRLFILGKPGAGKTTLLKYVTLMAARGGINWVPVFVSLHDWAQSGFSLIRYMEKQFEICEFPDAEIFIEEVLLKKGRAIILFDGLDEVNEEDAQRQKITRVIEDFSNQYWNNKYLITCRVSATDYSFEKFSYVEIADFSPQQVEIYARKWFTNQSQKGDLFLDELTKEENHGLRELAQTPILLNLLCLNFDETLYFPGRLVDLYQEAIDALLKKWDSSRNIKRDEIYRTISVTRKQQLLARIAAEFFDRKEILFAEKDLIKIIDEYLKTLPGFQGDIDGEAILKAIEAQHGLLVERAYRIHSFSHLTFQEYFVARYIIENGSDKILLRLMGHLSDKYWYEVFLMVVSLLPHADNFFEKMDSTLQDIQGYSLPIRLSRMLREVQSFSPTQRLIFLYISLAFKLNIRKEVVSMQELVNNFSLDGKFDKLPSVEKKASQIAKVILDLRSDIDGRDVPYSCLEALDSIRLPLSHFANTRIIPSGKNRIEKMISVIDDINIKIRAHINKAQKITQDLISVVNEIRKADDEEDKEKSEKKKIDNYMKLKKLRLDISKTIENILRLLNKIDEIIEISFSKDGADWALTQDEIGEFLNYLYVQKLLLECLRVASVSNRKKIIEKMFLQ